MTELAPRTVFHEPWWLDAVAPDAWDEVVVDGDAGPVARWRFARRRRRGLTQIGAPALSPYLGPEVARGDGKRATRLSRDHDLKAELIGALPRYDVLLAGSPPDDLNHLPFGWAGFEVRPRVTYELRDLHDLDARWKDCGESTRRAIRKAEKRLHVGSRADADDLHRMMRATFGRQGLDAPVDEALLDRVVGASTERGRGMTLSAVDDDGRLHGAVLLVWDDDRAYYLGGGADPELRSSGAQSLLLWEAVKHAATTSETFDFEGSMVPGIERFFRGFGAHQQVWFQFVGFGRVAGAGYRGAAALRHLVGR